MMELTRYFNNVSFWFGLGMVVTALRADRAVVKKRDKMSDREWDSRDTDSDFDKIVWRIRFLENTIAGCTAYLVMGIGLLLIFN